MRCKNRFCLALNSSDCFCSLLFKVQRFCVRVAFLCLTFASSEGRDLSGSGSDVVDDGILEPGYPEDNDTVRAEKKQLLSVTNINHPVSEDSASTGE